MSDDTPDPTDVEIEPRARRIATLGGSTRSGAGPAPSGDENCGVLPPFSGVLQREAGGGRTEDRRPGANGRSGRQGSALEYLTLRPLVVEHLRERTERETAVETVERVGEDASDGNQTDDATETTVREFIRRESNGDDGDGGPAVDDVRDDGTASLEPVDASRGGDEGPGPAGRGDDGASERGRSNGDAESHPRGDSPFDRSADAGDATPGTTLDVGGHGGPDGGGAVDGRDGDGAVDGRDGPERTGPSPTEPIGPSRDPPGDGRPDLVVAERSTRDGTADADGRSGGPSLTVPSPDADGSGDGADRSSAGPGADGNPGAASRDPDRGPRAAVTESDGPPSATPADPHESVEALPLDLDAVDRPDLDRFVDQLSDELERRERVERERRGL